MLDNEACEAHIEGITYKDNYEGNALAAMVSPGKLDIRYHKAFSDSRVRAIVNDLLDRPELCFFLPCRILYQWRDLGSVPQPEDSV